MSIVTSSPIKYVWATGALIINLIKFPLLFLYYLPNATRPHREWTIFQSVLNHAMNCFLYRTTCVKAVTPLDLKAGPLGDRFAAIPKAPDSVYLGITTIDQTVKPGPTGGIWYPSKPQKTPSATDRPAILHFHPGGYAIGDVRTDSAFAAKLLTEKIGSHAFMSLYRLASNPNGRFPAALQDALAAYYYLLNEVNIPASRIVLSGDSAGGHIVICMLRYLAEHGGEAGLPAPKGALLWSPAIDMLAATKPETISDNRNYANDYLDPSFVTWGAQSFVSHVPQAARYMNPLGVSFKSPCPIWVFCGGNEVFCDEITNFVRELRTVPDNEVEHHMERLTNHDIFFAGNLTGWKEEAEKAAVQAGEWVQGLEPN